MIRTPAPAQPRVLSLNATTDEAVQRLRGLPGLVWLDTAGHRPESDPGGGLSLITAAPRAILTGNLRFPAPLESALAGLQSASTPQADYGFPLSGLFGSVDYDGSYTFGLYDEVLIHRHATGEWIATGPQLPAALASAPPAPLPDFPGLDFIPGQTPAAYEAMVHRAHDYIRAGDI
jgi:hypothetical protein